MTSSPTARIFFSYARRDREAADRVFAALEAAELTVYRDTEQILPAEDWRGRLEGLIARSDGVLFVMSPNSVRSPVCAWEVEVASRLNKRIVPVVIADIGDALVPEGLERLNYIFATPAHDFDAAIAKAAEATTTDIDWVRTHTTLGERAEEWADAGCPRRSRILRGDELSEAEAWIAAQPANAPPPTSKHRAWIAVSRAAATRRQRSWLIGALAVAALSAGLGVWAELNRRIASEQRDRAELILDRGSQTANDLVFDLARRFGDREGVPQDLVRDMLERSRELVDRLAVAGEDRPDLLRSRAAALAEMSQTLARLGENEAALNAAGDALEAFEALIAADPGEPQWRMDRLVALDRLGDIRLALGLETEAEEAFDAALASARELAGQRPDDAALRGNLAVALEKTGQMALNAGDAAKARASFMEALALRRAVSGDPHKRDSRGVAVLLERLGDVALAENDLRGALAFYGRSLVAAEALAETAPQDTLLARDLSVIHQKLGDLLVTEDDLETAVVHFEADAAIARRLRQDDPARLEWARDLVISDDRLGVVRWSLGDAPGAVEALARAHDLAREVAADARSDRADKDRAARMAQKLSLAEAAAGDSQAALRTARTGADDLRGRVGMEGELAAALNNVAWFSLLSNDPAGALAAAEEALALDPEAEAFKLNRAHALMFAGDADDARAIYLDSANSDEWRDMVDADFETFRANRLETPLMTAVETALDAGGK
ncbi:toll/interleukin-1 receptor domain-containing protein [Pikeienuella piscinae]|uniref:Toll/interleukin-1 receptor domain-containing protein n=1 Tax=Pikeienuella piscinae TaxID=2748098 RepID=A0A7L5C0I6_9RHOB|nr:TIR domain-containing protein [Pikeienuella piscinae]QIE55664.1 toll/interleukin-1 receptor domain-containing protein [Pikeienuella piscinae]